MRPILAEEKTAYDSQEPFSESLTLILQVYESKRPPKEEEEKEKGIRPDPVQALRELYASKGNEMTPEDVKQCLRKNSIDWEEEDIRPKAIEALYELLALKGRETTLEDALQCFCENPIDWPEESLEQSVYCKILKEYAQTFQPANSDDLNPYFHVLHSLIATREFKPTLLSLLKNHPDKEALFTTLEIISSPICFLTEETIEQLNALGKSNLKNVATTLSIARNGKYLDTHSLTLFLSRVEPILLEEYMRPLRPSAAKKEYYSPWSATTLEQEKKLGTTVFAQSLFRKSHDQKASFPFKEFNSLVYTLQAESIMTPALFKKLISQSDPKIKALYKLNKQGKITKDNIFLLVNRHTRDIARETFYNSLDASNKRKTQPRRHSQFLFQKPVSTEEESKQASSSYLGTDDIKDVSELYTSLSSR